MEKVLLSTLLSLTVAALAMAETPPVVRIPTLSAPMAMELARATYDDCAARGFRVAVAVVGRDGRLVAFLRNPDAGPHTIETARGKAYSANTFRAPTTNLQAGENRVLMRDIPGALLIGGGLPINLGGFHYGAVGVSGAPSEKTPGDIDDACALTGIEAIADEVEMAD